MLSAQRTLTYEHLDMYCGLQYRGYEEQHHAQPNYVHQVMNATPKHPRSNCLECNPKSSKPPLHYQMQIHPTTGVFSKSDRRR